jgi:hypothetical protein
VFQVFQTFISSVSYGYYKSKSGCCICWNDKIHMLQAYVSSVSYVCCKRFFWIFQNRSCCCTCYKWLYMHVSIACFKCFICLRRMLQIFYLDVSKVYRGVARAAIAPVAGEQRLALVDCCRCWGCCRESSCVGAYGRQTPPRRASADGGR